MCILRIFLVHVAHCGYHRECIGLGNFVLLGRPRGAGAPAAESSYTTACPRRQHGERVAEVVPLEYACGVGFLRYGLSMAEQEQLN